MVRIADMEPDGFLEVHYLQPTKTERGWTTSETYPFTNVKAWRAQAGCLRIDFVENKEAILIPWVRISEVVVQKNSDEYTTWAARFSPTPVKSHGNLPDWMTPGGSSKFDVLNPAD
jgi:hypothetical protein